MSIVNLFGRYILVKDIQPTKIYHYSNPSYHGETISLEFTENILPNNIYLAKDNNNILGFINDDNTFVKLVYQNKNDILPIRYDIRALLIDLIIHALDETPLLVKSACFGIENMNITN
jgi:hypothetical protein